MGLMASGDVMAVTETRTESLGERVSRLEGGYEYVATKSDISDLKTRFAEMDARIDRVDARIDKLETRMEAGFAQMGERMEARFAQAHTEMEARFAQMESRLMLRFGGMMVAVVGVIVAAIRFLG